MAVQSPSDALKEMTQHFGATETHEEDYEFPNAEPVDLAKAADTIVQDFLRWLPLFLDLMVRMQPTTSYIATLKPIAFVSGSARIHTDFLHEGSSDAPLVWVNMTAQARLGRIYRELFAFYGADKMKAYLGTCLEHCTIEELQVNASGQLNIRLKPKS